MANDDGGVVRGSLLMNREIPCGTMPANWVAPRSRENPINCKTEAVPRDASAWTA